MPVPPRLSEFQTLFDRALQSFFRDCIASVDTSPAYTALLATLRDFTLNGGKRLRPALLYYGYRCFSGHNHADLLQLGIACELMQSALLIHDDVMDRASTRRGKPTIHASYTRQTGDANFGTAAAILLGDQAGYLGTRAIHQSAFDTAQKEAALNLYHEVMIDECYGQFLDMQTNLETSLTEAQALDVIYYKTTRYTFDFPLQLAVQLTNQDEAMTERFRAIAYRFGLAFQLFDDILGVFGNEPATGKSSVSDLTEGKQTLLVINARKKASPQQRQILDSALGNPNIGQTLLEEVRSALRHCGAVDYVQTKAATAIAEAKQLVNDAALLPEGKLFLLEIADYLSERKS